MNELERLPLFINNARMMKQARIEGMKLARELYNAGEFDSARRLVGCCRYSNRRMVDWLRRASSLQQELI